MMPRSVGTCESLCLLRSGTMIMAKKTSCPISRADFRTKAKPVPVTIGNQHLEAEPKEFSTGSLGWYLNGKTIIEIEGVRVSVQIGLNLTIVGSKDLPDDSAPSEPDRSSEEAGPAPDEAAG